MISFSDRTLFESNGNYAMTDSIMKKDGAVGEWMLRSDVFINMESIAVKYVIHFWKNGVVSIFETEHPPVLDIVYDDVQKLSEWCVENGWLKPTVNTRLLQDQREFDFWLHMYRCGLIDCEYLEKHEAEETERFRKAYEKSEENKNAI